LNIQSQSQPEIKFTLKQIAITIKQAIEQ